MNVTLGFKSHSGWAVMVAIASKKTGPELIARLRIELIEEGELWAKQPYHAAENLKPDEARDVVKKGIESARRVARRQMRDCVSRLGKSGHRIAGCAVLIPESMPDWNTDEILAVHFRMHKAEGVLFPDALCKAAAACNLPLLAIREKQLDKIAEKELGVPFDRIVETISDLRKSIGPPWGKDHRQATLAAMIALTRNLIVTWPK